MSAADALAKTGGDVKAIVDTLADLLRPVVGRVVNVATACKGPAAGAREESRSKVK